MCKIRFFLVLMSILSMQAVLADDMMSDSKPCVAVAKACKRAGYARQEGSGKRFWMDCMKPLLLGQTVKGVNLDADTAKSCRSNKIDRMKKELDELQNVSS